MIIQGRLVFVRFFRKKYDFSTIFQRTEEIGSKSEVSDLLPGPYEAFFTAGLLLDMPEDKTVSFPWAAFGVQVMPTPPGCAGFAARLKDETPIRAAIGTRPTPTSLSIPSPKAAIKA